MKISVIIPARDEERSIASLLDGLLGQTRPPDEIVVSDNGSTDRTAEIVEGYARRGARVRLLRAGAGFPGRGRNVAASDASHEWLAFIDAGIRPERDWLEHLADRARSEPGADVVYGNWVPVTDSLFTECAAMAYLPPPDEVEGRWLRARFIASSLVRRAAWRAVGGFPEHLRSAEDILFMDELERAGHAAAYEPRAVVRWDIQPNLWRTLRRFTSYSRHNLRAGLWRQWHAPVLRRYALLAALLLPALVVGAWWLAAVAGLWLLMLAARAGVALRRNRLVYPAGAGRQLLRLCVLVAIIATLDAATIAGSADWLFRDRLGLAGAAAKGTNERSV
jgi:glycosyltransferase involved in cell wall biosynthesis